MSACSIISSQVFISAKGGSYCINSSMNIISVKTLNQKNIQIKTINNIISSSKYLLLNNKFRVG